MSDEAPTNAGPPTPDAGERPRSEVGSSTRDPPIEGGTIPDFTSRFSRGSFTYGIGSLLQRGIGFVLLPVYAHYLTPAEFGVVGIVLAVFSAFSTIFGMGLRGAVTRQYFDHVGTRARLEEYLGSVYTFFVLFGCLGAGALTLFGRDLFEAVLAQVPFDPFVPLALWAAFFTAATGILLSLYRAREEAGRYVTLEVASAVALTVFIVYFVVVRRGGAIGQAYGLFWSSCVMFGLAMMLLVREARPRLHVRMIRSALAFGLPLTVHLLASWVLLAVDRILLERMVSLAEVGLYTLGYQLGMIVGVVASAANSAWTPIFYDVAGREGHSARILGQLASVNLALSFGVGLLIILFGPELVTLIADAEYAGAWAVVPIIALSYAVQAVYFVTVTPIFFRKRTRWLPLLTGGAAGVNVVLNLLLIPPFGVIGAAWATLLAFGFLSIATALVARRQFAVEYETPALATLGGVLVLGTVVVWLTRGLPGAAAVSAKLLVIGAYWITCVRVGITSRLQAAMGAG